MKHLWCLKWINACQYNQTGQKRSRRTWTAAVVGLRNLWALHWLLSSGVSIRKPSDWTGTSSVWVDPGPTRPSHDYWVCCWVVLNAFHFASIGMNNVFIFMHCTLFQYSKNEDKKIHHHLAHIKHVQCWKWKVPETLSVISSTYQQLRKDLTFT